MIKRIAENSVELNLVVGSGSGTSGKALAFCPSRSGSITGTDLGLFPVQNCFQFILAGRLAFSKERVME